MPEQIKRVMGSRMFLLGVAIILSFNYGLTLIYVVLTKGHDPAALQITLGFLAGVGGVITGGASFVNVKKEENRGP